MYFNKSVSYFHMVCAHAFLWVCVSKCKFSYKKKVRFVWIRLVLFNMMIFSSIHFLQVTYFYLNGWIMLCLFTCIPTYINSIKLFNIQCDYLIYGWSLHRPTPISFFLFSHCSICSLLNKLFYSQVNCC